MHRNDPHALRPTLRRRRIDVRPFLVVVAGALLAALLLACGDAVLPASAAVIDLHAIDLPQAPPAAPSGPAEGVELGG